MPDTGRISKELRECQSDQASNVSVTHSPDDLTHLEGVIKGPDGTPYDGGVTMLKVTCFDMGGNIPGAVKKKIAEKSLAGHWPMVEYMLTGKIPEPF